MQEQCMLGNHASKQVCYWWAFQIIPCLNATNRHISSHVNDAVLLSYISPFTNGPKIV